jgi:hypothetical protein
MALIDRVRIILNRLAPHGWENCFTEQNTG